MSAKAIARILAVIALFVGMPLYWHLFPPRDPIDTANGFYRSSCCGSFTLRNGILQFHGGMTRYVVEHDKRGRYVLSNEYVGIANNQLYTERSGNVLKIYLYAAKTPGSLSIYDGLGYIDFSR